MEEYQLPQINTGARKKGQLYLGDLSNVMIWVRYNTHTHTYTQHRHTHTMQTRSKKLGIPEIPYKDSQRQGSLFKGSSKIF